MSLALAACGSGLPPDAHKMTADEIRQTSNMTSYGISPTNGQTFINYSNGGIAKIRTSAGLNDEGTVRVEPDGQVCSRYKVIRGGAEACFSVWTDGRRWWAVSPTGVISSIVDKRVPGNPEGL